MLKLNDQSKQGIKMPQMVVSSIGVGCLSASSAILFYDDILRLNFALIFCVDILC